MLREGAQDEVGRRPPRQVSGPVSTFALLTRRRRSPRARITANQCERVCIGNRRPADDGRDVDLAVAESSHVVRKASSECSCSQNREGQVRTSRVVDRLNTTRVLCP